MNPLVPEQHLQLPRAPVRPLLPQLHHALLQLAGRLRRTPVRTPALLHHAGNPLRPIAPQPLVTRRPRDRKFLAQRAQALLTALRTHHKTYPLLVYVHCSPRHPRPRPRARYLRIPRSLSPPSVKDVLITPCKGCHESEHRIACATKSKQEAQARLAGGPPFHSTQTNALAFAGGALSSQARVRV